jgi:leukotriene-A4 hydrolase
MSCVQDTPAVKSSYSAAVCVPAALTALMSAVPTDTPPDLPDGSTAAAGIPHLEGQQPMAGSSGGSSGSKVFYFNQKVCIPSYLIALAVGQLEKRDLSER